MLNVAVTELEALNFICIVLSFIWFTLIWK